MLQKFYDKCKVFNTIAGNDQKLSRQAFLDQQGYLEEEVQEIRDGIELNNPEMLLDGVVDTLVTALGHLQRLEVQGVDVREALNRIADNNLSKFIPEEHPETITDTAHRYGKLATLHHNERFGCYVVLRNTDNKIMKPANFVPVNLADLVEGKDICKGWESSNG